MSSLRHRLIRCLPRPARQALRAWNSVRQVRGFGPERWPESPVVRRLVRPGDVVVDAGANIGYITALLARWVGPSGLVHSIEPIPATHALLVRAVRELGLAQVRCHACAVSDQAGEAVMEIPDYPDGGENFYESRVVPAGEGSGRAVRQTVRLCTLDELAGGDRARITFMKMDVEGHEAPALRGARRILEQARPALLVEINGSLDEPDKATAGLCADLAGLGYGIYVPGGPAGVRLRRAGERAVDYYFLTPEQVANRLGGGPGQEEEQT